MTRNVTPLPITLLCLAFVGCAEAPPRLQIEPPEAPRLQLRFSPIKMFDFSWEEVEGADHYELLQSVAPGEPFEPIGDDLLDPDLSLPMPLHLRYQASYILRACNDSGCAVSRPVEVLDSMVEAIGYLKASNTSTGDMFGNAVALSGDGSTLAVGAYGEQSGATGLGGDQADDSAPWAGAVYVFRRDLMGRWSQRAYLKASNTDHDDLFGYDVALSHDGSTLAVSALGEASHASGIDGEQSDDSIPGAGAVYMFVRDREDRWSQQAYVKASHPDASDYFGASLDLSDDGNVLAVGATAEDGGSSGLDGDPSDDSVSNSGAVYVFMRNATHEWFQHAYVKAAHPGAHDHFGSSVSLSGDGTVLAVAARYEDSASAGIGGTQSDDAALDAGAGYVFERDATGQWSQRAYLKASNPGSGDLFGWSLALSRDGNTLAIGAPGEDSSADGLDGRQTDDSAHGSGAVYVFGRGGSATWSQQAYVKASDSRASAEFGVYVALSGNGNVLAVGATGDDSAAPGIVVIPYPSTAMESGAAYTFVRGPMRRWSQRAKVKAPNPSAGDRFGELTLSRDGQTLAVGARYEDGGATVIGGDQADDRTPQSGAVYLY